MIISLIFLNFVVLFFVFVVKFASKLFEDERPSFSNTVIDNSLKTPNIIESITSPVQKRTNFLIMGVDYENTRTDVMIVGCFNSQTNHINLLSIPRDVYVKFDEATLDLLAKNDRITPLKGYLKLNEVHHYAGSKYGVDLLTKEVENMLDIDIDYYLKINLDAFKYLIDQIGGVLFDVPQRMLYKDPTQDLVIDLEPGMQLLDGAQAEGLVRYRHSNDGFESISPSYVLGDLQRIQVQQKFLKALFLQALSKETLITNSGVILDIIDKYITTNFNIADIPKFVPYFKKISSENIFTNTISSTHKTINGNQFSYVQIDYAKAAPTINEIFRDDDIISEPSIHKQISIYNGSSIDLLGNTKKEILESDGYTVSEVSDYDGDKYDFTHIYVNNMHQGSDLLKYFKSPHLLVDKNLDNNQIKIVLGINES